MTYTSRLLAMSRDRVPVTTPRVAAGDDVEVATEEVVEVPVSAGAPQVARVETAAPRTRSGAAPGTVSRDTVRDEARSAIEGPTPIERRGERTSDRTVERTVERYVVPAAATPPLVTPERSPQVSLPPQAQWLVEDTRGPDPLVEGAESDALRDLMRTVRQWTSSPPSLIESQLESSDPAVPAPVAPQAPAHQISIGNVTITVDDVPQRAEHASAPARSTTDRMARHLIREPR